LPVTRLFGMAAQLTRYHLLSIEVAGQAGLEVCPGLPLGRTSPVAMWTPQHFRDTFMRSQRSVATTTQQETRPGSSCLTQALAMGQHRPALLPLPRASPSRFTKIRFCERERKHSAPSLSQKRSHLSNRVSASPCAISFRRFVPAEPNYRQRIFGQTALPRNRRRRSAVLSPAPRKTPGAHH